MKFMMIHCLITDFNPRTRVECDQLAGRCHYAIVGFQSTHSCRVRRNCFLTASELSVFQSTHSCRVRLLRLFFCFQPLLFQSTHSCRVRLFLNGTISVFDHFNPRTRVECDVLCFRTVFYPLKFQSTHSCRVRPIQTARSMYPV